MLLGSYLSRLTASSDAIPADVENLTANARGARTTYCHNFANFEDGLASDHPIIADPRLWEGRKVIFIVREPKDVLVSAWFHARYRTETYTGSIQNFIRSPLTGIQKLVTARNKWWDNRERALQYEAMSYEQMHRDAADVLRQTLRFLDRWPVDEALITWAVDQTGFDAMRKMEIERTIDHGSMRPVRPLDDNPGAHKVRSGRIGGYREHLTESDIAYVDDWASQIRDPFSKLYN